MKQEIKILITGDFYGGNRINDLISTGKYDEIFNDFSPIFKANDLLITNLESALTNEKRQIEKTGPAIKASIKTIDALKYAGFNLLTLANNHIMDFGLKGLSDTIELCQANEIGFVGAGRNLEEASQVYYKTINEIKIAFINIAENEWSTTQDDSSGANPLNPVSNYYAILEAKKSADYIFVIIHGGHEYYEFPSPRMKQTYRFFIDAGANAVIGHHTHCHSGYEIYNGNPIFYSLGNFIFDSPQFNNSSWNKGFAVQFIINDKGISFVLIPYSQNNSKPGVFLLNLEEKDSFEKKMSYLNEIINDDSILKVKFDEYFMKVKFSYNSLLEPHSNNFIHALQNRKYIPSFLRKKKKLLLLNLIRCESHKDIIQKLLENENRDTQ